MLQAGHDTHPEIQTMHLVDGFAHMPDSVTSVTKHVIHTWRWASCSSAITARASHAFSCRCSSSCVLAANSFTCDHFVATIQQDSVGDHSNEPALLCGLSLFLQTQRITGYCDSASAGRQAGCGVSLTDSRLHSQPTYATPKHNRCATTYLLTQGSTGCLYSCTRRCTSTRTCPQSPAASGCCCCCSQPLVVRREL
jgi:hypothetical protein